MVTPLIDSTIDDMIIQQFPDYYISTNDLLLP